MRISFGTAIAVPVDTKPVEQAKTRKAEIVSIERVVPGLNVFHIVFRWLTKGPACTPDMNVRFVPTEEQDRTRFPRDYSTAGDTGDGDTFALCVGVKDGGVVSPFLTSLETSAESRIPIEFTMFLSEFPLPEPEHNVMMVANGTGISAFRGFMQYMAQHQSNRSGKVWLLDGVKDESQFLYGEELLEWARQIGLDKCTIETVLSSQPPPEAPDRKYVQHRFEDRLNDKTEGPKLLEDLRDPKTHLYICGRKDLANIREALQRFPAKPDGSVERENLLQRMERENRLHISVY